MTERLVIGNGAISGAMNRFLNARVIGRPELDIRDPFTFPVATKNDAYAIITGAVTSIEMCERYPEWSHSVNVTATLDVAQKLFDAGWRVVLLSSSAAIDGNTVYGQQKRLLEYRWGYGPILRLPKVLHAEIPVIENWLGFIRRQERVPGVFDTTLIQPIGLSDTVNAIDCVSTRSGCFEAAGFDCTWLDVALQLSRRIASNCVIQHARGKHQHALMNADKLVEVGWNRPPLSRVIDELLVDASRLGLLIGQTVLPAPVA